MATKRGIQYIPAIDGLRAIAVIAVTLYHLGISWIPGGFLGVDLFFVISGYVITRLLLDSIQERGGLDLRDFYMARIRRLLPPLVFMIVVTSIVVGIWAPDTTKKFLTDAPFSLFGGMNWWLVFNHQDYFESSGRPPLLQHTWSLAVEAQFYLLWPLILLLVLKYFGKKVIPAAALTIAAISGVALMLVSFQLDAANSSKVSHVYFGTDTHSIGLFLGAALAVSWIPQNFHLQVTRRAQDFIDGIGVFGFIGILATFAALSAEGNITGRGPERKADREALIRDGWQPYSIKVGDKYYSYSGMEPVSALMAIAADYAEYAQHETDAGKIEEVFLGATYGLYEYLKEQPYLQGVAEVAKLVGTNQQGAVDGKKIVDGLVKQFGGFVIGGSPAGAYSSLLAGIERLSDPTNRDTRASPELPMGVRGFVEAFNKYKSRLPYFSADLPEALNLWGDETKSGTGAAYEMVLPTRVTPQQFSEVDDSLVRMGSPIGMPERKIDGVEMDAVQYNRLLTIYGKELPSKQELLNIMQTPGFDLLSLDDQQKTVQRVHSKFMDAAKQQLKSEEPSLQAKIDELKELRKANGLYYKPD